LSFVQLDFVDEFPLTVDEAESHHSGVAFHQHRPMIVVVADHALGERGTEAVDAAAAFPRPPSPKSPMTAKRIFPGWGGSGAPLDLAEGAAASHRIASTMRMCR